MKDLDVKKSQERTLLRRQIKLLSVLLLLLWYMVHRSQTGQGWFSLPHIDPVLMVILLPMGGIFILVIMMAAMPLMNGRSPHLIVPAEQVEVGLSEVVGLDVQVDEVRRTLDTFLGYATFREELGGTPRRGILFEGPPGTGKTYLAKAMAKEAGVPFLFVAAPQMQSMWFGMSAFRVRSFFRQLRKVARKSGGAIGFIEEIDAIGGARGQMETSVAYIAPDAIDGTHSSGPGSLPLQQRFRSEVNRMMSSGGTGMVNELLIQMQSFDQTTWGKRTKAWMKRQVNKFMPPEWKMKEGAQEYNNILLIAATNRADSLDKALLRPGRFDRRLFFDVPTKAERQALIGFFVKRKANELTEENQERLAHETLGYTPVEIEHLFDEGLLIALREGRRAIAYKDLMRAKLIEELGMSQATKYGEVDQTAVAVHEAGHATVAYILGDNRRLEVLSIIKRGGALGLLSHSDAEERYTRTKTELEAGIAIAFGGQAAEDLFIGESGTGPAADLQAATQNAALMVGALGMSGTSRISFNAVDSGAFGSNLVGKVLADKAGRAEMDHILNVGYDSASTVLEDNKDIHSALTAALIERHELVREDITEVIEEALAARS